MSHPTHPAHLQGCLQVIDLHAELQQVAVELGAGEVEQVVGPLLDVLHNLCGIG
jgi:hypothetical protein